MRQQEIESETMTVPEIAALFGQAKCTIYILLRKTKWLKKIKGQWPARYFKPAILRLKEMQEFPCDVPPQNLGKAPKKTTKLYEKFKGAACYVETGPSWDKTDRTPALAIWDNYTGWKFEAWSKEYEK